MAKKPYSILKYLLSLLVAGLLLWLAFRNVDWKEFLLSVRSTRWGFILLSLLAGVVALVFRVERWRLQLAAVDPEIGRERIWHGSNIGNFLSLVIPGIGEFYRCAHVSTKKCGYDRTFGTILLERSWDVLAIALLLFVALWTDSGALLPFFRSEIAEPLSARLDMSLWWIAASVLALASAALVLVFRFRERSAFCRKCAELVSGVAGGIASFGRMRCKWLFLLCTVGIWASYVVVTYCTFLAIPALSGLGFGDAVFISAVGNIASVIPTPGNLGPYHYLVGTAISTIYLGGAGMGESLLCATLSHGSHALLVCVLGLCSYVATAVRARQGVKSL